MKRAKCFQELFFNGLFGKLFLGSKSARTKREFLLQNDETKLWSQSYLYLLLPLESLNEASDKTCRINWRGIDSCASVGELLKNKSLSGDQHCNGEKGDQSPCRTEPSESQCMGDDDIVHFANCSVDISNLKDRVVLAIHTGKIYSVVEMVSNTSAESPFEGNTDDVQSKYASYTEYFNKK